MENSSGLIGQTLGQYRIIEQAGQGGMATVFKAYQPGLNRDVALKVLPPNFATQAGFTERFVREAQAIGNLHHPNILPVYDSGQEKGFSYLVMRYITAARTLTDEMKSPLKTERIIELITQIGGALDHAHEAGIIHRDIKPSNILLDGQWALLSDFGLAKMIEGSSDLTGSGVGMGTPAYMSPEQGMGKKVDYHTDIYALGIILYEMLTGQVPHRADTPMATVLKRINEPLPMPRSLNPNIPEAVERVLLKVLAPDPAQRYDSAGELAAALKTAFGPTPAENIVGAAVAGAGSIATASPLHEATHLSAKAPLGEATISSPVPQSTTRKSAISATTVGFGLFGLLLVLILAGIGFLIFRPGPSDIEVESNPGEVKSVAAVDTATPIPSDTPISTDTPVPTDTPRPTDTPLPSPTATATPPPSPTPLDTVVSAATAQPTVDAPMPDIVPADVLSGSFDGQEIYDVTLVEVQKWQADAVLSEISSISPIDAAGKAKDWTLDFWSPSTKGYNSVTFIGNVLYTSPSDRPVPQAVVAEGVILDTKRLYEIGDNAGAAQFTAEGYLPIAGLTPYPNDETRLTWYLNYSGGDYVVVYTVVIDAISGEVIFASE